jgi:Spx/MgsR family transcriptional regulator
MNDFYLNLNKVSEIWLSIRVIPFLSLLSMIILYGIPNCNSVKKAMDWLTENQIDYQFHNYKKQGITSEKLTSWLAFTSWEKLLNKAGTTYKKLSDDEKASITDTTSAIEWLMKQNSMVKRPILEANGKLLVGFDEQAYHELFA